MKRTSVVAAVIAAFAACAAPTAGAASNAAGAESAASNAAGAESAANHPAGTQANQVPALSPQQIAACAKFSELSMRLEQNATDGDTEVVLFAKGQDEGLKNLAVFAPNFRMVAFLSGDPRGIGLREFHLESAEPPDLSKVLASFPRGNYFFVGRDVKGKCLLGSAVLSHALAPATALLTPLDEQVVPVDRVLLSWSGVTAAQRYIVELNNETAGTEMTFEVLPPTTSVAIPAQLLARDSEYQFVVGVKTKTGNATFVERTFFTAP